MDNSFFKKNVIIHTHIEKAAGTSFVNGLESLFGKDKVHDFRPRENSKYPPNGHEMYVFSGHFHYEPIVLRNRLKGNFLRRGRKNRVYIATFRDPISRFISFYNYVINGNGKHAVFNTFNGKTLNEAYEIFFREKRLKVRNGQCAAVTGMRKAAFEDAVKALEKNYSLCIPYYQVNDALNLIGELFDVPTRFCQDWKKNVGVTPTDSLSPENMAQFKMDADDDIRLFKYVEDNYEDSKQRFRDIVYAG